MQALLVYVCALVLVDTIFFSALTPLLPPPAALPAALWLMVESETSKFPACTAST